MNYISQVGADSGRHTWFKWRHGPVPDGDKTTQAITLFDFLLLSVKSAVGTDEFVWREPLPCSENVTRVLGILIMSHLCSIIWTPGALIGEENLPNLSELVLLLQEREDSLKEGFSVTFKDQEFNFVPEFVDR